MRDEERVAPAWGARHLEVETGFEGFSDRVGAEPGMERNKGMTRTSEISFQGLRVRSLSNIPCLPAGKKAGKEAMGVLEG